MIEILLPVFNGEKYLREQIDSILFQTNQNWILKIRNDGSTDNSQVIIDEYITKFPKKIIEISSPKLNCGLISSLNYLLESASEAEYIMFADQDDVWLPDKIEQTLIAISEIEKKDPSIPVMICTDATCVDQNLNLMYKSFFESQKFLPNIVGDKYKMLAINEVQGCTIMINKYAYQKIFPLPTFMKIHDMWIGVICAHYGVAKYINYQTLYYRQHPNNTLGGRQISVKYFISRLKNIEYLIKSRYKLFKILPFRINYLSWISRKIYYAFLRI